MSGWKPAAGSMPSLRLTVLGLAALLAGIGAWSFIDLPIDAFPDMSTTQVKIILKAPA